jgi:carboxyl-terminal processing protease
MIRKSLKYILLVVILVLTAALVLKFLLTPERRYNLIYSTSKITKVINQIQNNYVDSVDIKKLEDDAIREVLKTLDPHSVYLPPKETKSSNEELTGKFYGIGIRFNINNDTILVVNTISGGPSAKVGIMPGDRIITCDDSTIAGIKITNEQAMSMLKGDKGTKVKLQVKRNGSPDLIDFELTRDKIKVESIPASYMIKKDVGYIKINNFSLTTYKEFVSAIAKLQNKGMKKILIDLRGNGGGILSAAAQIANEFLPAGKLIVYTKGIHQPRNDMKAIEGGICLNKPVVILIDSWSASASEILSGALQDNDMGTIVGRRSFGKGLVQKPIPLGDGSELRLTIAKYYTPTGRCIQKPFGESKMDYYSDIYNRFKHGEFNSKDSIHVNDSLKFVTPKGKVVYGGGGIIPDYFVPLDTLGVSPYYTKMRNKVMFYKFVLNYVDNHRKQLESFTNTRDVIKYIHKDGILNQLIKYAKKEHGIKYNAKDFRVSKKLITTQINALVVQNIFDENSFYEIINKEDNVVQKALEVI